MKNLTPLVKIILFILFITFANSSYCQSTEVLFKRVTLKPVFKIGTIDSSNVKHFLYKADSYEKDQQYFEALKELEHAKKINPLDISIYLKSANINRKAGLSDAAFENYSRAIQLFEEGVASEKSPYVLYNTVATYLLKNQKYAEAERNFCKALAYRHAPFAIYNRGVSRLYQKKNELACADFTYAKQLDVKQAFKMVDTYCAECSTLVDLPELLADQTDAVLSYPPNKDTVYARIFFEYNWEISNEMTFYYRECNWIISKCQFDGKFTDYFGYNRLAEGTYTNGMKSGLYTKYYQNGNIEHVGNFKNDKPFGFWHYYYADKKLKMQVFFKGDDFVVKSYFDENGNQLLTDGNGMWKYETEKLVGYLHQYSGYYKDNLRDGNWTLDCKSSKRQVKEKYKDGVRLKTKLSLWNNTSKEDRMFFRSSELMEARHQTIKNLWYSSPDVFNAYPIFKNPEMMSN